MKVSYEGDQEVSLRTQIIGVSVFIATLFFLSVFAFSVMLQPAWRIEYLGFSNVQPVGNAIAIDSEGRPCVAFFGENYGYSLNYAQKEGNEWKVTPVSSVSYYYDDISMALDSDDNAHVCTGTYPRNSGNSSILYATNVGGAWNASKMNITGHYLSSYLAVDSEDRVHIFYTHLVSEYNWSKGLLTERVFSYCRHLISSPTGWNESVEFKSEANDWVFVQSLALDTSGSAHAIFLHERVPVLLLGADNSTLSYATNSSGNWTMQVLEQKRGYLNGRGSMTLDSEDRPHVCFYSLDNGTYTMTYDVKMGDNWTRTHVAYAGNVDAGASSIGLDSEGRAHVSFSSSYWNGKSSDEEGYLENHSARYATNKGGVWQVTVIDTHMGRMNSDSTSIAADTEGNIHITYFYSQSSANRGDVSYTAYATSAPDPDALKDAAAFSTTWTIVGVLILGVPAVLYLRRRNRLLYTKQLIQITQGPERPR